MIIGSNVNPEFQEVTRNHGSKLGARTIMPTHTVRQGNSFTTTLHHARMRLLFYASTVELELIDYYTATFWEIVGQFFPRHAK
jgi:hypothetical protein